MISLDCLGLCLAWIRTRGPCYVLSMIFGITGTLVSLYNQFGQQILIKLLQRNKNAAIINSRVGYGEDIYGNDW
jgi:hypothetical protein